MESVLDRVKSKLVQAYSVVSDDVAVRKHCRHHDGAVIMRARHLGDRNDRPGKILAI